MLIEKGSKGSKGELGNVLPRSTAGDIVNGSSVDIELSGDVFVNHSVFVKLTNRSYSSIVKSGISPSSAKGHQSQANSVFGVFFTCNVFEVINPWVALLAVNMINLVTGRTRAEKGCGNKSVNKQLHGLVIPAQRQAGVSVAIRGGSHYGIQTRTASKFNTLNITKIGNLINTLVTDNIFPYFYHIGSLAHNYKLCKQIVYA